MTLILQSPPLERARRLGRKYVIVAFAAVGGAFTVLTTEQLVLGVFVEGARPLASSAVPLGASSGPSCGESLRRMEAAVERAVTASGQAIDETAASDAYRRALAPEWDGRAAVESRCAAEKPGGTDALASVVRLRVAGEQLARRHASELAPLRRDVASYLPPTAAALPP